ncbi:hypothetical protein [Rhodovulum steppense]|uniref:hypothetical protein n=1 Tax=Rhodovulum steppense TaxID=540251 RepID=UPI0010442979|nr:hypothetical protein [Rhodovulum steppense]
MAYPLLLLVGQWVVTGGEGRVGSFIVMPEAGFWPEQALVLGAFGLLAFGFIVRLNRAGFAGGSNF